MHSVQLCIKKLPERNEETVQKDRIEVECRTYNGADLKGELSMHGQKEPGTTRKNIKGYVDWSARRKKEQERQKRAAKKLLDMKHKK